MKVGLKTYNAEAARKAAEAREKAAKFAILITTLESQIALINVDISDAETMLKNQHETFVVNADSAEGEILSTFDTKESDVWKGQYEAIITKMKSGLLEVKTKKSSAEQSKIYWEQVAEMWEARIYV